MILSRGRSNSISTVNLLPDWVEVLVPESQRSDYEAAVDNPIITTPDDVCGLGTLRNWCLDNFSEEIVIMLDDDIQKFYCLTGAKSRAVYGEEFVQVLINTAVMAQDIGAGMFGFYQTDIRKYKGYDPFSLCGWIGTIVGVIGRKHRFRNDKFKVDIDYSLQNLLIERIIFMDTRYYAGNFKDSNRGGNSEFRTRESFERSIETLEKKWGRCIKVSRDRFKGQCKISLDVKRKQSIRME